MSFRHGFARTIGAALGLFAMLVVTLLAPVHQAHAVQRDLARATGDLLSQVICHGDGLSDAQLDPDGDARSVKCPVCSLAKQVGATPSPILVGIPAVWHVAHTPTLSAKAAPTSKSERTAQPRAPPCLV